MHRVLSQTWRNWALNLCWITGHQSQNTSLPAFSDMALCIAPFTVHSTLIYSLGWSWVLVKLIEVWFFKGTRELGYQNRTQSPEIIACCCDHWVKYTKNATIKVQTVAAVIHILLFLMLFSLQLFVNPFLSMVGWLTTNGTARSSPQTGCTTYFYFCLHW